MHDYIRDEICKPDEIFQGGFNLVSMINSSDRSSYPRPTKPGKVAWQAI